MTAGDGREAAQTQVLETGREDKWGTGRTKYSGPGRQPRRGCMAQL